MQMGHKNKPANVIITFRNVVATDSNSSIQNKIKLFYELCVGLEKHFGTYAHSFLHFFFTQTKFIHFLKAVAVARSLRTFRRRKKTSLDRMPARMLYDVSL